MLTENRKEKCSTLTTLGLEAFKVFMACLLSLFVSQKCKDHDCNISEKFSEDTTVNYLVLTFNFFTLAVFLVGYNIEYLREQYIIHHFNNNPKLSDHHIAKIIDKVPEVQKRLISWNRRFYYITVFSIFVGLLNFIFSGLYIFYHHYNGIRTLTSLVTNILLVSNTVYSNYKISRKSYLEVFAYSSSRMEPISYNDFDDKIKSSLPEEAEPLTEQDTQSTTDTQAILDTSNNNAGNEPANLGVREENGGCPPQVVDHESVVIEDSSQ